MSSSHSSSSMTPSASSNILSQVPTSSASSLNLNIKVEHPSTSSSSGTRQTADQSVSPKPMSVPTSLSEWQLMAVLNRANLVQYYDTFISQGGDDINQIMQCDETEFLEIMSLVRMLPKPLHVRRLQKALTEYSKDQTAFNLDAIQQIGPPPPSSYNLNGTDPMALLLPGVLNSLSSTSSDAVDTSSASPSQHTSSGTTTNSVSLAVELSSTLLEPLAVVQSSSSSSSTTTTDVVNPTTSTSAYPETGFGRATANIMQGHNLGHHFGKSSNISAATASSFGSGGFRCGSSQEKEGSSSPFLAPALNYTNDFVSLGDSDPNNPSTTESPVLSAAQILRLAECALAASKNLPHLPPRLVQNKKRVSKEVLELLHSPSFMPNRVTLFRKFSAIYGRFDTKRKPHKVLTLHETTVNEAASQLCLLVPALLTRRDELFPLARQIVKDAGYHYAKSRKRPCDPADLHSPISSPSNSPPPGLVDQGFEMEYLKHEAGGLSGLGGGAGGAGGGGDEQPSSSSGGGSVKEEQHRSSREYSSTTTSTASSEASSILEQWASEVFAQQKRSGR